MDFEVFLFVHTSRPLTFSEMPNIMIYKFIFFYLSSKPSVRLRKLMAWPVKFDPIMKIIITKNILCMDFGIKKLNVFGPSGIDV